MIRPKCPRFNETQCSIAECRETDTSFKRLTHNCNKELALKFMMNEPPFFAIPESSKEREKNLCRRIAAAKRITKNAKL